ncbi:MAG TPA: glucose-1-phosphate thymidylyltransferase [Candidatus Atribacteria bacterium]|nr:glucose-1-phosphate thymidylyltransferase [Candidatus Atribacteria bacterium]
MKSIILCAGKGTRLRPLTHTSAKHLIPIANKPVLFYAIEAIKDCGVTDIGVIVGETAEDIKRELEDGDKWGVSISYIEQKEALGLAHAVLVAQDFLGEDKFLMYLGDNLLKNGVENYARKFVEGNYNAFVLLTEVGDPRQFGVAELEKGRVVRVVEKPKEPVSNLALIGVYFFDKNIHQAIKNIKPSARGELEITDAIQWMINQGYKVGAEVIEGWWKDTGKPNDILEANRLILEDIERDISEAKVDEKSEILGRVKIGQGTEIINSKILGPVIIGKGARVVDSYVGPFTSLSDRAEIKKSEIECSVVLEESKLENIKGRMQRCLIGRGVEIYHSKDLPRVFQFTLGDHSKVGLL